MIDTVHRLADSSLDPSEIEEQEVERLIGRKAPPSRKHTEHRGPKFDNRRRRIKQDDSDLTDSDYPDEDLVKSASNEAGSGRAMRTKSATYHGVLQQGHPSGPTNTVYRSYDKRYFGNDHYEMILKYASDLLKEDWLKYNWDGGSEDAPLRAALDLSIGLSNDHTFQNKIDSETYEMLLNRLSKWDHDSFAETILPLKKSKLINKFAGQKKQGLLDRSASMNKAQEKFIRGIIQTASDLREKDPKAAFEIIKNLRALVSSEAVSTPISVVAGQQQEEEEEEEGCKTGQQEQQGQQQEQQGQKSQCGQQQQQQGQQQGQQEQQQQQGQQEQQADTKDLEKSIEETLKGGEKLKGEDAIDPKAFEEFLNNLEETFKKIQKTSAVILPLSLIIRTAATSDAARQILLPVLAAAKKKIDKKKDKKKGKGKPKGKGKGKGKSKSKSKASPFGGKQAPPFGGAPSPLTIGDKKASRKASYNIEREDLNW
jgi:hypothetical protein